MSKKENKEAISVITLKRGSIRSINIFAKSSDAEKFYFDTINENRVKYEEPPLTEDEEMMHLDERCYKEGSVFEVNIIWSYIQ